MESSDQAFLHVCDCCQFEGTESEAIAFCVFCTDYLCDTCLRVHKKSRVSREHEILEGDAIKEARGGGTAILAVELCDNHRDKKVTFYCSTHDNVFCDVCRSINHRKCSGVKKIPEVSECKSGETKVAAADILRMTQSLTTEFKELESQRKEALTEIAKKKTSCLQEIKKLRNYINKLLDQLMQHLVKEVSAAVNRETETISNHLSSIENATKALEARANILRSAVGCGEDKVFIAMKKIRLPKLKKILQDITKEKYQEHMEMEAAAPLVQALQGQVHHLSQVKLNAVWFTVEDSKLIRDNVKDRDLNKMAQYNVTLPSEEPCYITGCQVLPNRDFLLCDHQNRKLKILNLPMGLTSHIQLPGTPYDVSLVSLEEAVVTLPESKEIQFVSLKPKLALARRLPVERRCWGVVYSRNQLYVACGRKVPESPYTYNGSHKEADVLVLNLQGQVLTTVNSTHEQPKGAYERTNIAIAKDITGRIHTVSSQDTTNSYFNKASKLQYKDKEVSQPGYILTDMDQNAYICGANSKLQIFTHDGQPYRTLLEQSPNRRPKGPTFSFMAYRSSDKTLLVGMQGNVAVYGFV